MSLIRTFKRVHKIKYIEIATEKEKDYCKGEKNFLFMVYVF